MTKWEYKIVKARHITELMLDIEGERGWELVSVIQQTFCICVIFKRPINNQKK